MRGREIRERKKMELRGAALTGYIERLLYTTTFPSYICSIACTLPGISLPDESPVVLPSRIAHLGIAVLS
jgi:hypothetical protein